MKDEFKSEVIKVFNSDSPKKVSIIKWGDNNPTIDIRRFNSEGRPLKGISLTPLEIDDVIVNLNTAKLHYSQILPSVETVIDKRDNIDILNVLKDAPRIVEHRSNGIITENSMLVFKLTPYMIKRIERMKG